MNTKYTVIEAVSPEVMEPARLMKSNFRVRADGVGRVEHVSTTALRVRASARDSSRGRVFSTATTCHRSASGLHGDREPPSKSPA